MIRMVFILARLATADGRKAGLSLRACSARMYATPFEEVQKTGAPGFVVRARMYAATGKRDEALKIIAEMKKQSNVSPMGLANVYNALGEKDQTFEYLEKAYAEGAPLLRALQSGKTWDPLRSDPRFKDLLKRMGLPQQ